MARSLDSPYRLLGRLMIRCEIYASVVFMAAGGHHGRMKIRGRRSMLPAGRSEGEEVGESWCCEPGA
jgi:hypothetical protein